MLIALIGLLSAGWSMAQDATVMQTPRTPEQRANMQTQRLSKKLKLSAEQQAKVKEIFLARAQKVENVKSAQAEEKKQRKQQVKATKDESDAELKKVLTEEQYLQMEENRHQKMREKRKDRN